MEDPVEYKLAKTHQHTLAAPSAVLGRLLPAGLERWDIGVEWHSIPASLV